MTFLEPALLAVILPFIALPIIIHFINRMRYTPMDWAAMDFLFKAKRSSTKFAKLREILILACRCLAILCLGLALARPLSGGWLGWAFSGSSDTVIILLDRSSSMGVLDESGQKNKLSKSISMIKDSARSKPASTKFVLVDSATGKVTELEALDALEDDILFGVSDSSVDMHKMVQSSYEYISSNNPGNCEIWVTGDLQQSNWKPDNAEWATLNADFKSLNAKVKFRMLALSHSPSKNIGIRVKDVFRYTKNNKSFIDIGVRLTRNYTGSEIVRVKLDLNSIETVREVEMTQEMLDYIHTVEIDREQEGGFGSVSIPKDQNPGDNSYYFAYGSSMDKKTAVISKGKYSQLLALAAAPLKGQSQSAVIIDENQLQATLSDHCSLVIIQNSKLSENAEKTLLSFTERGGQVLLFPPLQEGSKVLNFIQASQVETAKKDQDFMVNTWDEFQGPLAKSRQGESLPVNKLYITSRQTPSISGQVMASYKDGKPFLSRFGHGKGAVYYCSSGIERKWSDLYKGGVLLPMIDRLVNDGAKQYSSVVNESCRYDASLDKIELLSGDEAAAYKSLSSGVYKDNEKVLVLNRPDEEDEDSQISEDSLEVIFSGLDFSMFNQTGNDSQETMQSELFSLFTILILLFLTVEGFMTLRKPHVEVERNS